MSLRPRSSDVLDREEKCLGPYASASRNAHATRRHPEDCHADDLRTPYQHDRDRILHSVAFRRLQHKTQVYVLHEGDFFITRLTHSIEVAQIARSLAQLTATNEDLVEGIALSHDVGHAPFGHMGELSLQELMESNGETFEHNLQALRTVDELEARYPEFPGLNLTSDTREGIARHDTSFDAPKIPEEFARHSSPSLEAQLTSLADTIAFCTHDVEDALRIRLIGLKDLTDISLWREAAERYPGPGSYLSGGVPERQEVVENRTTVRNLIRLLMSDVADTTRKKLSELHLTSPKEVREHRGPIAALSETRSGQVKLLCQFLRDRVYSDPKVLRMGRKGRMIVRRLCEAFMDEGGERMLPWRTQERLKGEQKHRVVCDFIAGMTDRMAMDHYDVLYRAYEPSMRSLN